MTHMRNYPLYREWCKEREISLRDKTKDEKKEEYLYVLTEMYGGEICEKGVRFPNGNLYRI